MRGEVILVNARVTSCGLEGMNSTAFDGRSGKFPFHSQKTQKKVYTQYSSNFLKMIFIFIFFIIGSKVGMATRSATLPSIRHLFKPQKLIF